MLVETGLGLVMTGSFLVETLLLQKTTTDEDEEETRDEVVLDMELIS